MCLQAPQSGAGPLVGACHSLQGRAQTPGTRRLRTYLIQVLLFLLHSKLAPLGPLLPLLSLFLCFFLIRDPEAPLPTRSGLLQKQQECEGLFQPLKCWKSPCGLKEPLREGPVGLCVHQGRAPNTTRDMATPTRTSAQSCGRKGLSAHTSLSHTRHCCPQAAPSAHSRRSQLR